MPDDIAKIYEEAERFKTALLKRERAAASRMIRVYGQSWTRLSKLLMAVTEKIGDAQRRGQPISPAWLFQQERFARLMVQVEREMRKFADVAERSIVAEQAAAVKAALADSTALAGRVAAATPGITATFTALPVSAVESIAGFLGNGSPLRALLDELPADAGKVVGDLLQEGIALGYNPRKTAAKIRHAMGMHLNRALMIARTETLRAYREATIQNYRANDDVVMGWWWTASLSRRTCPSCIALHGTWHPLSERMESHPRCRCTQIPGTKDSPPPLEKGTEWFAKQDEATQRAILVNNATFNAYKDGKIALQDLVGRRIDPRWGSTYHHLSLKRALNGEGKFPGYKWPAESGLPIGGALPVKVLPPTPPLPRVTVQYEHPEATKLINKLFGPNADRARIAAAAGAFDGSTVSFNPMWQGTRLQISVKHPYVSSQERMIYPAGDKLVIHNDLFVKNDNAPAGLGAAMLKQQVEFAPTLGISKITTEAAGDASSLFFNGYYTWPRYGYNAKVPAWAKAQMPASLRSAKTMLDLYETAEGREWWKNNGSTIKLSFDLTLNSRSRQTLEQRLSAKTP